MAAGRGIGSVHVDVEADTKGVKPELVKAFKSGGEAAGKAAKDAINDELAEIGGPKLKAAIQKVRRQIEEGLDDLDITLDFDEAKLRADIAKMKAYLERQEMALEIDPDLESVFQELQALQAYLDAKHPELNVDLEIDSPADELKATQARLDAADLEVEVDVKPNRASMVRTQRELDSFFGDAGVSSGSGFGDGFGRGLSGRMKAIIAGVLLLMEPAAVALEGLAASLTSVLSSAVFGVGAAAGAATPLLVGLIGAVAGVMLAMDGMGDAMSAIAEEDAEAFAAALENLSPAAAAFATAVQGIWGEFEKLRDSLQEELFVGLADNFENMARVLLPELSEGLGALVGEVNEWAAQMMDMLAGIDFGGILAGLAPAVGNILAALTPLIEAFFRFVEVATPAATELSQMFLIWAQGVAEFDATKVTDFLERGLDSLSEWLNLFSELSDLVGTVFMAGVESGDGFISKLTEALETLNEFLDTVEGQQALENFFATGERIIMALVPLVEGLAIGIHNMVTPESIANFEQLAETIGEFLPMIGTLFSVVSNAGVLQFLADLILLVTEALEPLVPIMMSFTDAISEALGAGLEAIGPMLDTLVAALEVLLPALEPVIPVLFQLFTIKWQVIAAGVVALAEVFAELAPVIVDLLDVMGPFIDTVLAELGDVIKGSAPLLEALAKAFTKLLPALEPLVEVIGAALITAFEALAPVIDILGDALVTLAPLLVELLEAVTPLIPIIGELLGGAFTILLNLLEPLLPVLTNLVSVLIDALAPVIPPLVEAFVALSEALAPVVEELGAHLAESIATLAPLLPPLAELFIALLDAIIPLLPIITDLMLVNNRLMTEGLKLIMPMLVDIIGIFTEFANVLGEVIQVVVNFVDRVVAIFKFLYDVLVGNSIIPDLIEGIFEWFNKLFDLIGLVADVFQGIYNTVSDLLGRAKALIETILGGIRSAFDTAWGAIKTATSTAWEAIKGFIVNPITTAKGILDGILDGIEAAVDGAWDGIKSATQGAWNLIKSYIIDPIQAAYDKVSGIVDKIVTALSFAGLVGTVTGVFNSIKDAMVRPIQAAFDAISGIVGKIKSAVSSIPSPGGIVGGVKDIFTAAGGLFSTPQMRVVGEAGREAVIPLDRPISQINPEVRGMAEVLRGIKPGGGMTNYWTINESGDAEATAHKVINRLLVNAA